MKLIPNWKAVLAHAWSVKLLILSAVASYLQLVAPIFQDFMDYDTFLYFNLFTISLAFILRLIPQKGVTLGE